MTAVRTLAATMLLILVVTLTVATWGVALVYFGLIFALYRLFRRASLEVLAASLLTGLVLATWAVGAAFYWGRALDHSALLAFTVITLVVTMGCVLVRAFVVWLPSG